MASIEFSDVRKSYGTNQVVHGISLKVVDGEFVVLVGPSGCGKSTLLRMVAGLEEITSGSIRIGDRIVNDLEPKDRDCAMVFQNYALYPHMSVYDNMAYGLKIRKLPKADIDKRVNAAAEILELEGLLTRKPRQLSGGQRQRVAMGRAIVREPAVFLFDEPLSNLDAKLRVQTRLEIQKLHRRLRTTSLYVTHDQVEAMTLAQRMIVMNAGRAEQVGTPDDVYSRPATTFVASFIGSPPMNLFEGRLDARRRPLHRARRREDLAAGVDPLTGGARTDPRRAARAPAARRRQPADAGGDRRDARSGAPDPRGRGGSRRHRAHRSARQSAARNDAAARLQAGCGALVRRGERRPRRRLTYSFRRNSQSGFVHSP